jgi:hypothetical protein
MDQVLSQSIQGEEQRTKQRIGTGFTLLVEEVQPDGSLWLKTTHDWVLMEQSGPMGAFAYDSAKPPPFVPPPARGFAALQGKGFSVLVSPRGRVQDVRGLDALLEEMLKEMDLPEGEGGGLVEKQFRGQFGEEAMKGTLGHLFLDYPGEPVAVGDSWNHTFTVSAGIPMILDATYTLKHREGGTAVVEARAKIRSNPEAPPLEMGTSRLRYEIEGTQEAMLEIDVATGRTVRGRGKTAFSGTLKADLTTPGARGVSIPITGAGTSRIEPFEKK